MPSLLRSASLLLLAVPLFAAAPAREGLVIDADARVELLGVLHILGGLTPADGADGAARDLDYEADVKSRFGALKDHPAVKLTASVAPLSKQIDAILRFSAPPELKRVHLMTYETINSMGGQDKMDKWLASVRDFAKKSNYLSFYADRRRALQPVVDRYRAQESEENNRRRIEQYMGMEMEERYLLVITPLVGTHGGTVGPCERAPEMVSYIGAVFDNESLSSQGKILLRDKVNHYVSHTLNDILIDLYEPHIDRLEVLYDGDCVGSWRQCVKEHMTRAVMIRAAAKEKEEEVAARLAESLARDSQGHYPFLPAITALMKAEFETDRKNYPTMAEFFPRILDLLSGEAKAAVAAGRAVKAPRTVNGAAPGTFAAAAEWTPGEGATGVFVDERLRRKGVALLDRILARGFDKDLALRRASLLAALGDQKRALADLDRVLAAEPRNRLARRGRNVLAEGGASLGATAQP